MGPWLLGPEGSSFCLIGHNRGPYPHLQNPSANLDEADGLDGPPLSLAQTCFFSEAPHFLSSVSWGKLLAYFLVVLP